MDKLKEFIDSHRDEFDYEPLPKGHVERFERRLPAVRKRRKIFYLLGASAVAACFALLLTFYLNNGSLTPAEHPCKCQIQQETEDLRRYYHMQMSDVTAAIEEMYKEQHIPGAERMLKESKQILAKNSRFEKEILPTLPCTDASLNVLNQYYLCNLNSISSMLEQLKERTKTNNF